MTHMGLDLGRTWQVLENNRDKAAEKSCGGWTGH
jgi:hypothetical protein